MAKGYWTLLNSYWPFIFLSCLLNSLEHLLRVLFLLHLISAIFCQFWVLAPGLKYSPWRHCVGMVSLKRLIINSDSPATCLIEERNQSTSHWCHLTKNMPRFEFSVSLSLCLLFSLCFMSLPVPTRKLPCESVSIYESIGCVCMSLTKGFVQHLLNSTEGSTWGMERGILYRNL